MKVNNRRRASVSKKTASAIALCVILVITLADEGGSVRCRFAADGHTYQMPEITFTGECGVDLTGLAIDISRLQKP